MWEPESDSKNQESELIYSAALLKVPLVVSAWRGSVRNLCYMVTRREKMFRTYFRVREGIFEKQVAVLSSCRHSLSQSELSSIADAQHGLSIYDSLYAHPVATLHRTPAEFETLIETIRGNGPSVEALDKKPQDLNGMRKHTENPYRRSYPNGPIDRRSRSRSASSLSGSESEHPGKTVLPRKTKAKEPSSAGNAAPSATATTTRATTVKASSSSSSAAGSSSGSSSSGEGSSSSSSGSSSSSSSGSSSSSSSAEEERPEQKKKAVEKSGGKGAVSKAVRQPAKPPPPDSDSEGETSKSKVRTKAQLRKPSASAAARREKENRVPSPAVAAKMSTPVLSRTSSPPGRRKKEATTGRSKEGKQQLQQQHHRATSSLKNEFGGATLKTPIRKQVEQEARSGAVSEIDSAAASSSNVVAPPKPGSSSAATAANESRLAFGEQPLSLVVPQRRAARKAAENITDLTRSTSLLSELFGEKESPFPSSAPQAAAPITSASTTTTGTGRPRGRPPGSGKKRGRPPNYKKSIFSCSDDSDVEEGRFNHEEEFNKLVGAAVAGDGAVTTATTTATTPVPATPSAVKKKSATTVPPAVAKPCPKSVKERIRIGRRSGSSGRTGTPPAPPEEQKETPTPPERGTTPLSVEIPEDKPPPSKPPTITTSGSLFSPTSPTPPAPPEAPSPHVKSPPTSRPSLGGLLTTQASTGILDFAQIAASLPPSTPLPPPTPAAKAEDDDTMSLIEKLKLKLAKKEDEKEAEAAEKEPELSFLDRTKATPSAPPPTAPVAPPFAASISSPMAVPVAATKPPPVPPPAAAPTATPIPPPVATHISPPVAALIPPPIAATKAPPIAAPIQPPVTTTKPSFAAALITSPIAATKPPPIVPPVTTTKPSLVAAPVTPSQPENLISPRGLPMPLPASVQQPLTINTGLTPLSVKQQSPATSRSSSQSNLSPRTDAVLGLAEELQDSYSQIRAAREQFMKEEAMYMMAAATGRLRQQQGGAAGGPGPPLFLEAALMNMIEDEASQREQQQHPLVMQHPHAHRSQFFPPPAFPQYSISSGFPSFGAAGLVVQPPSSSSAPGLPFPPSTISASLPPKISPPISSASASFMPSRMSPHLPPSTAKVSPPVTLSTGITQIMAEVMAEEKAKKQAAAEAKKQAMEEAKKQAMENAKKLAMEEAKKLAMEEARKQALEETNKKQALEEAKKQALEEAAKQALEETKKKQALEETKKKQEMEEARAVEEAKNLVVEEAKKTELITKHSSVPCVPPSKVLVSCPSPMATVSSRPGDESRSQLKMKIKGPFLDPSYATSSASTAPVVSGAPPVAPVTPGPATTSTRADLNGPTSLTVSSTTSTPSVTTTTATSTPSSSGPSLSTPRGMRKKELLRVYCSEESIPPVNGPAGLFPPTHGGQPPQQPPHSFTRPTMTHSIPKIPKAMASINTKAEFKNVVAGSTPLHRKVAGKTRNRFTGGSAASPYRSDSTGGSAPGGSSKFGPFGTFDRVQPVKFGRPLKKRIGEAHLIEDGTGIIDILRQESIKAANEIRERFDDHENHIAAEAAAAASKPTKAPSRRGRGRGRRRGRGAYGGGGGRKTANATSAPPPPVVPLVMPPPARDDEPPELKEEGGIYDEKFIDKDPNLTKGIVPFVNNNSLHSTRISSSTNATPTPPAPSPPPPVLEEAMAPPKPPPVTTIPRMPRVIIKIGKELVSESTPSPPPPLLEPASPSPPPSRHHHHRRDRSSRKKTQPPAQTHPKIKPIKLRLSRNKEGFVLETPSLPPMPPVENVPVR
ncbi:unnamed protein product [Cyprideis torosa]|uniref:Uncharacterized protein n=1 Tax=Cyprideis torosa TaxID=163714 RepID=A0A7R8WDZ2_9CRUS|nr:unnamed protein product [Cyprideis torosa]CAG0889634.1 unnamed protein product [Cyprideis torosa]